MIITIDGLAMKKKEDFYQNIKEELDVPEYFGNNLDALYDFLTEQPDILQVKFLHYNAKPAWQIFLPTASKSITGCRHPHHNRGVLGQS